MFLQVFVVDLVFVLDADCVRHVADGGHCAEFEAGGGRWWREVGLERRFGEMDAWFEGSDGEAGCYGGGCCFEEGG